jgi:transcriptional regulator
VIGAAGGRRLLPLDGRKERRYASFRPSKGNAVPSDAKDDLLQGTLDMLVLTALQLGPLHGWGITERLESGSRNVLQIGQGSLYPSLYRLEKQGFVRSEWRTTENNRRGRYYSLTRAGTRRLVDERRHWARMSDAINMVLSMSEGAV